MKTARFARKGGACWSIWRGAFMFGIRMTILLLDPFASRTQSTKRSGFGSKPERNTTSSNFARPWKSKMTRPYKDSDWPKSRRRIYEGERRSKRRLPALTPLEQYIEEQKQKERLDPRPFDDPLPF
jgi:hypothetical protein